MSEPLDISATDAPESAPRKGFWQKLKRGLNMTHTEIFERLEAAAEGRGVIDEETLESLEESLIGADLGVETSLELVEGIKERVRRGEAGDIVKLRAAELGIEIVRQGSEEKRAVAEEIVEELGLAAEQVCYLGDDLPDLAAVQYAGLGVAVADACTELCEAADYVTAAPGGHGAVRETIEMILKFQKRWDDLIQKYGTS